MRRPARFSAGHCYRGASAEDSPISFPLFPELTSEIGRRPTPLLDAGLVARDESIAVPFVVVAVQVPVEQVKQVVTKGGVAIDVIAGRASCHIDAISTVADALIVVQVVVAGHIDNHTFKNVHGEDVVVDMRVGGGVEEI